MTSRKEAMVAVLLREAFQRKLDRAVEECEVAVERAERAVAEEAELVPAGPIPLWTPEEEAELLSHKPGVQG